MVSPDSQLIATCGNDCTTKLWQASTAQLVCTLEDTEGRVERVHFSRDSRLLVTVAWQVMGREETSTGADAKSCEGDEDDDEDARLRFSISVWAINTDNITIAPSKLLHTLEIKAKTGLRDLHISPDCRKLALCRTDQPLMVWNLHTRKHAIASSCPKKGVCDVKWAPDSKVVACVGAHGVAMWNSDLDTLAPEELGTDCGGVLCCAFANKTSWLAIGTEDALVVLYELPESGKKGRKKAPQAHRLTGHEGNVMSVSFSPKDACVVSWSEDTTVRVWAIPSGMQMRVFSGINCCFSGVVWLPGADLIEFLVENCVKSLKLYSVEKVRVCVHACMCVCVRMYVCMYI